MDLGRILEESGAILKGHFILTSGRHSDTYVEKFRILEQPPVLSTLCAEIAAHFAEHRIDVVVGPTTGGIIIAFEVARQMGVSALYVETEKGAKTFRRGAEMPEGARVLVVDDVLTTGTSAREVLEVVQASGGTLAGVAVLIDRSTERLDFGVPLFAAHRVEAVSYAPDAVPDWLRAIAPRKPGTRLEPM